MKERAFIYVATSRDDLIKRVLIFGTPQTPQQLRCQSPRLTEVTGVEIAMGQNREAVELYVGQISGVDHVEMLGGEAGTGADFHVTRNEVRGDWRVIVPGIVNIIGNLLGEDYDVSQEDFTYEDTPPAA